MCCSVLQCVAVCYSEDGGSVTCFAVCCSVLHGVAWCCNVLLCVAVCIVVSCSEDGRSVTLT